MREPVVFCIFKKCDNFLAFQARQTFVITICKSFSNYFFHNSNSSAFIEFLKCIVISVSVYKFNIYRHKTFSYQQVIVYDAPDATITIYKRMRILKSEVQPGNTFNYVFMIGSIVISKYIFKPFNDFFRSWSYMTPYPDTLIIFPKPSSNIISNVGNKH